jgi:hypothetical protein
VAPITEIAKHTFNTGENKFAAQFTESRERVAGYVQRGGMEESYLVAETIRTGTAQTIALPHPVDANAPDKADLDVICVEVVKSVAKRQQKLKESLKRICYSLRPKLGGGTRQVKGHQGLGRRAVGAVAA